MMSKKYGCSRGSHSITHFCCPSKGLPDLLVRRMLSPQKWQLYTASALVKKSGLIFASDQRNEVLLPGFSLGWPVAKHQPRRSRRRRLCAGLALRRPRRGSLAASPLTSSGGHDGRQRDKPPAPGTASHPLVLPGASNNQVIRWNLKRKRKKRRLLRRRGAARRGAGWGAE